MFKVGDRVRCISIPPTNFWQFAHGPNALGKIYKINKLSSNGEIIGIEDHEDHWFGKNRFELVKDITTDIGWLDAIQNNFKEGV